MTAGTAPSLRWPAIGKDPGSFRVRPHLADYDAARAAFSAMLGTFKNASVFCPLFSAFGPEPARLRQDLELDSLDFLRLVEVIDTDTGVDIPERDYPAVATVDGLVGYLGSHG